MPGKSKKKVRWQQRVHGSVLDAVEDILNTTRGRSMSSVTTEALELWIKVKEAERGSAYPERGGEPDKGRWRNTERDEPADDKISVYILRELRERFYDVVWHQPRPDSYVGKAIEDALMLWVKSERLKIKKDGLQA